MRPKKNSVEILFHMNELTLLVANLTAAGVECIKYVTTPVGDYSGTLLVFGELPVIKKTLKEHNNLVLSEKISFKEVPAKSNVLRPPYYNQDDPYEVIKVIRAWKLDFECGNAIKYIARAGKKNPDKEIEDIDKAITYLQMKNEVLKAQRDANQAKNRNSL